ncbi:MAG: HYR domain-containing protein [Verrucomicrobia bacterium]|nr:HYR domain-containing protein [Verrucomicrobiota bacterium]
MKTTGLVLAALLAGAASSSATILSVTGNDTLVGNHTTNLILNGSFEADGGVVSNGAYWATGTTLTPAFSLTSWSASGQSGSYAHWGNDGLGGIKGSAPLPHGTNALYFGAGIMLLVAPFPIEATNGLVTFTSTPAILPKPGDGPVTLQQTVSGLNPAATYLLDFWTSGEDVGKPEMAVDGFFGLDITGEPTLYFAAPSGNGLVGASQRYQVYFTPTASTVTFQWSNWGHDVDPNGFADELVLDDIILNKISGPEDPLLCGCLTNITVTCPAVLPDLCALATNCFTTNMLPGSCTQNLPPGMPVSVGTYVLNLQVLDLQSNAFSCPVTFTVVPPSNAPPLTVLCSTNKTVECGSEWDFDPPVVTSFCCGLTITPNDIVVSNSPCSQSLTRTWLITDGCGNTTSCSQEVTLVDTTPPGTQCDGQNLVPNGGFERYTNCPSSISQFAFAAPWFTPTDATTDYYNSCSGAGSFVTTPTNSVGVQAPLSGQAYAGAALYTTFGTNPTNSYREYLEVPLLTSLTAGQQYLVSFYVSRAEYFGQAIADIGAKFFPMPFVNYGPLSNAYTGVLVHPIPPQVANPPSNMLTDSTNWTLIQGLYTAIGWETHLVLGNFKDDPGTTATLVGGQDNNYAYYYFDNVSVVAVCDPAMTNQVVQCGTPWEIPPFPVFDNCNGGNITVSNYTATNGYCPTVVQRDWYLADPCGNTNRFTQTVTIVDTNPPQLLCAAGANLAPNPQFENYAFCPFNFSQVSAAGPWFNPTVATPDYLNTCSSFPAAQVPNNLLGSQTPFSGNGYMGAYAYSVYGTNPVPGYREYLEAPLLVPLQAGQQYQVSFRVCLADTSGWSISDLGAHFSVGPVLNGSSEGPLNVVPQVANPPGNLLTNQTGWMLVQGVFTAAGGEDHITLGNFLDDASTLAVTNASGTNHTYYYYDDIAVVPLCEFTNKFVACESVWEFDTPLAYDSCSGEYLSTFVTSTTTSGTCPKVHTRIWTIYDACNNWITATQTVTEVDTVPPELLCSGLNLVPNADFENTFQCAGALSFLPFAQPWFQPTIGSPDLYNPCATLASGASVPVNMFGSQTPFAGQNYAGGYVYFPGGAGTNSYREYLTAPLFAPLVAGQSYAVSFRVSRGDNCAYAAAEIGAHFSAGPLTNYPGSYLAATPQIVNPPANVITSATNWTLISGVLTAGGGEDYITIGNFLTDASTTASFLGGSINSAYYYYDDVRVIALCTNVPVKTVACGEPWEFDPAPLAVDRCAGSNVTVTLAGTITNSLCPVNVVRTWTLADACGNATNWSQTILALTNGSVLAVNCECLLDNALALLTTNACQAAVPDLSGLSNSPCILNNCGAIQITQSPAPGTPVGAGSHPITVRISNCAGLTNTCVLPFYVNPPQPTLTCPPNLVVYGCSNNSAVVNYAATATGHVGPILYSPPSGSLFSLGTHTVTCTATNLCGGANTCTFTVTVRPPHRKWGCLTKIIGIISYPPPVGRVIYRPDFPGGGRGVDLADFSGTEGVRFDLGPAEKFTFSTMLDFDAPTNASFELHLPPGAGLPTSTPLVRFERSCEVHCGWDVKLGAQIVSDPTATFRAAAINLNGELLDSVTVPHASLGTNVFASLSPMDGSTNGLMTVTFDLRTRSIALEFPSGDFMPSARHKGWDGCIYGNRPPRTTKTNHAARVIITPQPPLPPPPITELSLAISNLATLAFDNPAITMSGRKWSDGHVTLMKAYDDGSESGMEFSALGASGGLDAELGHAASFSLRLTSLDTNGLPLLEQQFAIRGWPPGTTTNRPPPPVINVRLAPDNSGLGGVQLGADLVDWGVSEVTLQLWDGPTLVAETNHVPAMPGGTLAMLGGFPGILGCPGVGVVSLSDTNPIIVLSGLDCGTLGCVGTELRILAETSTMSTPPTAYTDLTATIGEEMDYLIHDLQSAPACVVAPLQVARGANSVTLSWEGDGFHLQGAESVSGPWYDLGVESPATIPAGSATRVFRLRCD